MPQEPLPLDVANKLSSNNLLISKSYKCAICPSTFNQKTHLTTHIDSVHLKKKNYFCSKCDYAATRKGAVEKHVQAVHDKIKPFSCDMCALKFSQKAHMTAHFDAIHLKRKLQCPDCDYAASRYNSEITTPLILDLKMYIFANPLNSNFMNIYYPFELLTFLNDSNHQK